MPKDLFKNLGGSLLRKTAKLTVIAVIGVTVWIQIVGEDNAERGMELYKRSSSLLSDSSQTIDTTRIKYLGDSSNINNYQR